MNCPLPSAFHQFPANGRKALREKQEALGTMKKRIHNLEFIIQNS